MSDKEAEETDWTDFAADIAKLRAHRPQDPMPRLGRQGKPAENKLPAARKPGGVKTEGKETIMTDKKPTSTENDKANEKTGAEDYGDYGDPVRQFERYIRILDDFANETIRIRRTQYEIIKDNPGFIFADHNSLNDLLNIRRSMARLLKALKAKENQQ